MECLICNKEIKSKWFATQFDGKSYELLEMTCTGYTRPNKWWIIGNNMVPRNPKRYAEYKAKAKARGILWSSGSKKYEITF